MENFFDIKIENIPMKLRESICQKLYQHLIDEEFMFYTEDENNEHQIIIEAVSCKRLDENKSL